MRAASQTRAARPLLVVLALAVLPGIASAACGNPATILTGPFDCAETEVPEYVTGEIGEYITSEIGEYVTGEVATYLDREIATYVTLDERHRVVTAEELILAPFLDTTGAGDRRRSRFARLRASFDGDRLRIAEEHGFPRHRHRENGYGRITEHWTYPEAHTTFVFCGDRLIETIPY